MQLVAGPVDVECPTECPADGAAELACQGVLRRLSLRVLPGLHRLTAVRCRSAHRSSMVLEWPSWEGVEELVSSPARVTRARPASSPRWWCRRMSLEKRWSTPSPSCSVRSSPTARRSMSRNSDQSLSTGWGASPFAFVGAMFDLFCDLGGTDAGRLQLHVVWTRPNGGRGC